MSDYFNLGRTQGALDFVDVRVATDVPLFIDPSALNLIATPWADECRHLVQSFFHEVLDAIRTGDEPRAVGLLAELREPNETRLGFSRGRPRGSGLGDDLATDVFESLRQSDAVVTGLIRDLEDTALMVEGVDKDRISDITTNLIRGPLIFYTGVACQTYGIPTENVPSGRLWDPNRRRWTQGVADLPVVQHTRLLLVPKAIVRRSITYNAREYFDHYLLNELIEDHIRRGTSLVRYLRDGTPRVTKASLREEYGSGKIVISDLTRQFPDVLDRYRVDKRNQPRRPLEHEELAEQLGEEPPDWDALLSAVTSVPTGAADATRYHHAVKDLLQALFYPHLIFPVIEREILSGRKRIDISFTRDDVRGFFRWVAENHPPVPYVFVECKNYSNDPANPELDQLSGRFSNLRGRLGILTCRSMRRKDLFLQRCRDTARDGRGFILALDDVDLTTLVEARKLGYDPRRTYSLLYERFDALVL